MDKKALQYYAVWAKNNLEQQIEISLKTLGINSEKDIKEARKVGDFTIIDGDMNSYPADLKEKRDSIIKIIKTDGYKQVVEEFAYTWFNRIIALRFMEVHDFLPHGFRVLSSRNGGIEPEIMKNLNFVKEDLKLDLSVISPLLEQGKIDEAYRHVLFHQCKALSGILPMLFSEDQDFLELLLPKVLLKGETVLTKLLEINEEDFLNDVEVIGWLYQFYISQKKDEVFSLKATITKDTLPAVTQLFTPDWIVRYMAENSVGRIWLESYPNSSLKSEMKYYVEDAEQEQEVQRKIEEIKYRNVNPEDIKIIEPCCGSGHILVYIFDLLFKMYEEKGYQTREIPTFILRNNLVGLEIDKRAAQLASFSLVMKARSLNSRFFSDSYYVRPKVFEIWDSRALLSIDYEGQLRELNLLSNEEIKNIKWLVETFRYAKTIGSLLKIEKKNFDEIERIINRVKNQAVATIFNTNLLNEGLVCLEHLLAQAKVMSTKYDVMITNPPYQGIGNMEQHVKDYANRNYPETKLDMYSMFMDTDFVKQNGFFALINQHQWMFTSSFNKYRSKLIMNYWLVNAIHLGTRAFEEISGEKVQSVTFVFRKISIKARTCYFRLIEYKNSTLKMKKFIEALSTKNYYICSVDKFSEIQGKPYAYWISAEIASTFYNKTISEYAYIGKGLDTCDQDRFERLWHEVDINKISFYGKCRDKKWFLFSKGGGYRRWYGNLLDVVDWRNDGYEVRNYRNSKGKIKSRPQNIDKYFKESVTWSSVGTGSFGARFIQNSIFGNGSAMFPYDSNFNRPIMGLLNSTIVKYYLSFLSPTLTFNAGDLMRIPVVESILNNKELADLVNQNVEISFIDWSMQEFTWEFKKHYLSIKSINLVEQFKKYQEYKLNLYKRIKSNEERINLLIMDAYGLKSEVCSDVKETDISIKLVDNSDIKSLISYLIGVEMGRFSFDREGIVYAGGAWTQMNYVTYQPDDDGIIPIYSKIGMEDDLTSRIIVLIKQLYGENTYRENIDFIADALGKKNNESSEETLNRYLNDEFYADHLKMYQKRPIYWMFSSGKKNAFKCLIYMHRYSEDTLAIINSKYFLNESARLNIEVNDIRLQLETAEGKDKLRLEKQYRELLEKQKEMIEYGQVLDHMANQYIHLDLDDGVKVNYAKFQGIEIVNDNGTKVKKDLLVPIK